VLVNTNDIKLRFNLIIPDSIIVEKHDKQYFLSVDPLVTKVKLCLGNNCIIKESVE